MRSDLADLGVLAVFPPLATVLLGVLVNISLEWSRPYASPDNVVIWLSMVPAMVVVPALYLRRLQPELRPANLGLRRPSPATASAIALLVVGLCAVKLAHGADLPAVLAQNIPIAFCEEFWSKGVLFHQARKVFRSDAVVVLTSAAVFAFVTHLSAAPLINLLLRFPVGILTAVVYVRTRSLAWPVALHFAYNVSIS